jgi:hypothetical protein
MNVQHYLRAKSLKKHYKRKEAQFSFCTDQDQWPLRLFWQPEFRIPTATLFSWDNLPKATMVSRNRLLFCLEYSHEKRITVLLSNIKEELFFITGLNLKYTF